jgi:2-oxoisovalerate dehydrogenase E2 component (dihydrolipoyl transacylase)
LCEVITDKLTAKIPSSYAGKVTKLHYKVDEICQVGQPLLEMEVDDSVKVKGEVKKEETPEAKPAPQAQAAPSVEKEVEENVYTTPAVRNLARSHNVDISKVKGTGKKGRITKEDILNFAETGGKEKPAAQEPPKPKERPIASEKPKEKAIPQGTPSPTPGYVSHKEAKRGDKVVKLTGIRKAMVKSMTDSLVIPHYNSQVFFNIETVKRVRKIYLDSNPKKKFTMMPILIKAFSSALLEFPIFNSVVNPETNEDGTIIEYVQKADINMCLAIDTPSGLLVPNLKCCQKKSMMEINEEFKQLVERGRTGTVTQSDLAEGTFTLSNIGNVGCISGAPVIFRPQVAVAAVGITRTLPNFVNEGGKVKIFPMDVMVCCMSNDHRIINAKTTANFLNRVKYYLENLDALLLLLR